MEQDRAADLHRPESAAASWWQSLLLGVVLAAVYLANGREIGQYDTEPTTLAAYSLVRGDSLVLDRFRPYLREPDGRPAPYVARVGAHTVSRYPLATAILAAPLEFPQAAYFDMTRPGWDRHPLQAWGYARLMGKNVAAILAALVGVVLHRLLCRLGLRRFSLLAVVAACLGSDLWVVGSQALWQHGPAALMLTLALTALAQTEPRPWQFAAGGLAAALMVACRSIDLPFALALAAWVAVRHPSRLPAFLPGPLVVGSALLAYNLAVFGDLSGGQAALEAMHPELHAVSRTWGADPLGGLLGTLVSPARGLLVYSPWVAIAIGLAPWAWRRLSPFPALRWTLAALPLYLGILAVYSVWWGGHTFGPRYWTDAMPLFGILLAAGLEGARARLRLLVPTALLITWAITIQALGAWRFPTDWNLTPANVDTHHERLWDWSDTEIRRMIAGPPESTSTRPTPPDAE